jgi:DNA excision repair protein ERCC-8
MIKDYFLYIIYIIIIYHKCYFCFPIVLHTVTIAHNGHVNGLRFTDDGLFLISSGTDEQIRLWDVSSGTNMLINYGKVRHSFKSMTHQFSVTPSSLSFSPLVFVPSHSNIAQYEVFTGKLVKKLEGHYGKVTSAICSSNNIELYTSSSDGNILTWSTENIKSDSNNQSAYYNDTWSDEEL